MSICWYCHWGWAKPVADIYDEALAALGFESPLEFGPAHIVWSDENFGDDSIRSCLADFDESLNWPDYEITAAEKLIVKQSLERLLEIQESVRCCEPADYDGERPEAFPPPEGFTMVRR